MAYEEDDYYCPSCRTDLDEHFSGTTGPATCPNCGAAIEVDMDEWYDRETGNDGWHYWLTLRTEDNDGL